MIIFIITVIIIEVIFHDNSDKQEGRMRFFLSYKYTIKDEKREGEK